MEYLILFLIIGILLIAQHSYYEKLTLKTHKIMASIKDLNAKVDQLQAVLDAEQEQVAAALAKLEQAIANLEAIIEDGGTPEERQALSDKLDAVMVDLQSTIPDDASTTTTTTEAPVEPEPEV